MSINTKMRAILALGAGALIASPVVISANGYGGPYGFGSEATEAEIAAIDIDVMPDGRGAPPGSGDYETGKSVYMTNCLACHGPNLEGVSELGAAALIGGEGSLASGSPKKTVASYWPHASTLYDYVKRAMPFNAPGSLTDDEVYAVSAYILGEANILEKGTALSAENIGEIEMPNRDGFIADPRPDIFNYD